MTVLIENPKGKDFTIGETGPSGTLAINDLVPDKGYHLRMEGQGFETVYFPPFSIDANNVSVLGYPKKWLCRLVIFDFDCGRRLAIVRNLGKIEREGKLSMRGSGQTEKGRVCASCKRALPTGAKFCGFDGTRVDDDAQAKANGKEQKQCSTCGKLFPGYAQFCPNDASKLVAMKSDAPQPVAQPEVKPSPFAAPPGFAQAQSPAMQSQSTQSAPQVPMQPPAPRDLTETAPPIDEELARSGDFGKNQGEPRKPTQLAESFDDSNALFHNLIGKKIEGKYEVQSILGEGGMAIVYKAYHTKMERLVVIKVMQGWLLSNKNAVERFERESKMTAKLAHPNIVTVFDYGVLNAKRALSGHGIHQRRVSGRQDRAPGCSSFCYRRRYHHSNPPRLARSAQRRNYSPRFEA